MQQQHVQHTKKCNVEKTFRHYKLHVVNTELLNSILDFTPHNLHTATIIYARTSTSEVRGAEEHFSVIKSPHSPYHIL